MVTLGFRAGIAGAGAGAGTVALLGAAAVQTVVGASGARRVVAVVGQFVAVVTFGLRAGITGAGAGAGSVALLGAVAVDAVVGAGRARLGVLGGATSRAVAYVHLAQRRSRTEALGIGLSRGHPLAAAHVAAVIALRRTRIALLADGHHPVSARAAHVDGLVAVAGVQAWIAGAGAGAGPVAFLGPVAEQSVVGAGGGRRIVAVVRRLVAVVALGLRTGAAAAGAGSRPVAGLGPGAVQPVVGAGGARRVVTIVGRFVAVVAVGLRTGTAGTGAGAGPVAFLGAAAVQPVVGAGGAHRVVAVVGRLIAVVAFGFRAGIAGAGAGARPVALLGAVAIQTVVGAGGADRVVAIVGCLVAVVAVGFRAGTAGAGAGSSAVALLGAGAVQSVVGARRARGQDPAGAVAVAVAGHAIAGRTVVLVVAAFGLVQTGGYVTQPAGRTVTQDASCTEVGLAGAVGTQRVPPAVLQEREVLQANPPVVWRGRQQGADQLIQFQAGGADIHPGPGQSADQVEGLAEWLELQDQPGPGAPGRRQGQEPQTHPDS